MSAASGFSPSWNQRPAPRGSYRSIFKWGAPDEFKHPNARLYRYLKQLLGLTDEDFRAPGPLGEEPVLVERPGRLAPVQLERLRQLVGAENVHLDGYRRLSVAYGKTLFDLWRLRDRVVENLPDAVVCPRSREDVRGLVAFCSAEGIPLTVFGGGSSVTRGVECTRGGLSLDLRVHMNRILKLNPVNQTVTVEPGIYGPALEQALNEAPERFGARRRYTCGHFPQSFEYSTVGGWVVTRGAGQSSTYYGKIEHLVVAQEYITPTGELRTDEHPACAMGPDLDQILIGSEGAFGVLVSATLKVFWHRPRNRAYFSYVFPCWPRAVEAVREVVQAEAGMPSVFRLSDPEETDVGLKLYGVDGTLLDTLLAARGYRRGERCLLLGSADGDRAHTATVDKAVQRIAREHGAMSTTGFVTRMWERGRFRDPYLRDDLLDFGVVMDTLECAVPWDRVLPVWEGVKRYCQSRPRTACLVHMSHVYPQGTNLYIIFIAKMRDLDEYRAFHAGLLDQIRALGAAISHHHGIGKLLAPWLEGAIGTRELELLRAIKRHLDPGNIMNPGGTLALDLPAAERR